MKAAGAWDIAADAVNNFSLNGDANQAAAVALYAILSAIPLFILTLIAAGAFFSSSTTLQGDIIGTVRGIHPYFSEALLQQVGQIEGKTKVLGWIGLLGLVWLSAAIFNAIESALNIIFRSRRKRNYFVSKLMAIAMIPTVWLIGGLSVLITYLTALLAEDPSGWTGGILLTLTTPAQIGLRYILPYLMVVLLVTFVYRIIPTAKIRFSVALAGSAIFAFLVEIAKQLFTWYLANYTRYHVIFGSLETVVILVIWVFYVALIFLFCAEIMSSFERRDMLLLERALLKPNRSRLKVDARLFQKFGRVYARDEVIFQEGDSGCEMFYVLSGRVRMERVDGGVKKTLAEMGPGQYFGEMAALIDVRRTATARTMEDSHLAVIDDRTFQNLIRESREVALAMLREFAARLKNSNATLEEFSRLRTRLLVFMQILDRPKATVEEHIGQISRLTRKEPAEISHILQELSAQGIVMLRDNHPDINRGKMWSLLDSGI
ncbi:MAG TPA: YhjD/YihY/BrkB family envelope integrity protein [Smithellaceae bacterium]|nr:YhjD/YihY/BrkB family envelope integrity protein [Smithellaceae bacterium]HRV44516.1 YhjD/YihY/BrkB family envelope integrity protein [Smithellaceae bacterium]